MSLLIFIYFSETEYNCMQYISQNNLQQVLCATMQAWLHQLTSKEAQLRT